MKGDGTFCNRDPGLKLLASKWFDDEITRDRPQAIDDKFLAEFFCQEEDVRKGGLVIARMALTRSIPPLGRSKLEMISSGGILLQGVQRDWQIFFYQQGVIAPMQ